MIDTLTVTYSGIDNELLEMAIKNTLKLYGYIHVSTVLNGFSYLWEMSFRKV